MIACTIGMLFVPSDIESSCTIMLILYNVTRHRGSTGRAVLSPRRPSEGGGFDSTRGTFFVGVPLSWILLQEVGGSNNWS